MSALEQIGGILRACPGFPPDDAAPLSEEVLRCFRSWRSYRDSLSVLAEQVNNTLFAYFYERLGPAMSFSLPGGARRRVTLGEIASLTDDLMGVFFESLSPVYAAHYERLHAYWMETGSAAAMRCLIGRFCDLLPDQEKTMIEKYLWENRE